MTSLRSGVKKFRYRGLAMRALVAKLPPRSTLRVLNHGLRIVLVRVNCEARKRHEVRCRPFPHVADHLPAAERAVARGARRRRAVRRCEVKLGISEARRRLAPRPPALAVGQPQPSATGSPTGRSLPFGLGREPALGPVAPASASYQVTNVTGASGASGSSAR